MREKELQFAVSATWNIDDVLTIRKDLTREQCKKVLENVIDNHDANFGINWDVIGCACESLFPEKPTRRGAK